MFNRIYLGFLAIFILIVIIVLLAIPNNHSAPSNKQSLPSYASTDAVARLTIDGPINANQEHQAVQIDVGRDSVTYEQIDGYQGRVVNLQTYSNNTSAYSAFLYSLAYAGFTLGDTNPALGNVTGRCATGDRYSFELIEGATKLQNFWATNCGGTSTYKGNVSSTLTLFEAQVPNYNDLTSDLNI